ncbi:MAG: WG repeat-containing protein [Clostridia bacterium]|nr:WG repeat-containing protein [Clostridia bacterium]
MKRKYILIIIILVAIIIGVSVFLIMQNAKMAGRNYDIEKVEDFKYFVVQDGDNYGVIDKEGQIIIDPKYQSVVVPNPSKPIFICEPSDNKSKVLNEKNEELFTNYDEVKYIKLKNLASNLVYEKSVLKCKIQGKYGLIDFTGKEILKPTYGSIDALEYKEGELLVEQAGKYGVININGVTLVEPQYDIIKCDGYYTEENGYKKAGYIVGTKTEEGYRYGYVDVNGNKILDTEFNEISRVTNINDENNIYFIASKNGQYGLYKNKENKLNTEYQSIYYNQTNDIFVIEKSRKFGFADKDGKIIVETKYAQIDTTGKYIYAKPKQGETEVLDATGKKVEIPANISKRAIEDGKYSIVMTNENNKTIYSIEDKNGKVIIPGEYTYIEYLFDNYFIVCDNGGRLGVVDENNNKKIDIKYNSVQGIKSAKLIQAVLTEGNTTIIYNNKFEKLCELKNAAIQQVEDFIKIYNNKEVFYINNSGEIVTNKEVYPDNKLYAKQEKGKWGFVDKTGKIVVNCEYDKVTELNGYGFAGIYKNGKWGSIDSEGKIVQAPKYEIKGNFEPVFLGKYYQVLFGFGEIYFTNK